VGYRGTGKSTVGRLVADRLGWEFADTDAVIEHQTGCSIASLFAERGEPAFRDLEARVLGELTQRPSLVLATGGGVVLRDSNRERLVRFGFVVWLRAEPQVLAVRLRDQAETRPALTAAGTLGEIADVLAQRTPWYQEVADRTVHTDQQHPAAVAETVLTAFRAWCRGESGPSC
jgi:shikimate kinase